MNFGFPRRSGILALLSTLADGGTAYAQAWPARPVRMIIPYAPGGGADPVVRPVLEKLQHRLGRPFVADNRGGAGTALGTAAAAAAPADGYTLLYNTSALVFSAALQSQPDPMREFDPVAMLMQAPLAVIVAGNSPIRSVPDIIRIAKERPDTTFYATAGVGSVSHFAAEQFNMLAGTRMQAVPYRGMGPAIIALMAGEVQLTITTPASASGQIRDGLARIVAYTAPIRPPGTPDAPLIQETLPDYAADVWGGVFAPKGALPEIRATANDAINAVLREPDIVSIYERLGCVPAPMDKDAVARIVEREYARAVAMVRATNMKPD